MTTAIVYSERYLDHQPSPTHPERPERLRAITNGLKEGELWNRGGAKVVEPSPASPEDIELVHDGSYVEKIKQLSASGTMVDLDTPTDSQTYGLALLAAGGTIDAGKLVLEGEVKNAFGLVRPPGHHATRNSGGGFCYFNNIAIMVEKLRREGLIERAMIFDFDAHHGNGTQDIFYEDNRILYLSFHQDPRTLYPGTGYSNEVGSEGGEGYTVNVPFPPGASDGEYATAVREIFVPLAEVFEPDLVGVSVGLDAYVGDPLTMLGLSPSAYGWISAQAVEWADQLCGGRIVFTLEGGYAIEGVGGSCKNIMGALVGREGFRAPEGSSSDVVEDVKRVLSRYWNI